MKSNVNFPSSISHPSSYQLEQSTLTPNDSLFINQSAFSSKKPLNSNPLPYVPISNIRGDQIQFSNINNMKPIGPTATSTMKSNPINPTIGIIGKNAKKEDMGFKSLNVSEKPGYNFISVLKEFTDQSRMIMSFDYTPQINSFSCCCSLNKEPKGQGKGNNKQEAKKEASKQTIQLILKENPQHFGYFSKFLEIEKDYKLFPESNDQVYVNEKEIDSEAIVILNQHCQQMFQTNPSCEYEPCINGYAVTMRCGTYVEKAEGASKKIARQNAAKSLCDKLAIRIPKIAVIDEVAVKSQKYLGATPAYIPIQNPNNLSNTCIVRIVCGKYSEEAQGRTPKEAKILAADYMSKKLDMLFNKAGFNPFFSSVPPNQFDDLDFNHANHFNNELDGDKENSSNIRLDFNNKNSNFVQNFGSDSDNEEDLSTFLKNNENYDENEQQIPSKQNLIPKIENPLCDITNKIATNKYQDIFLAYAEEKLSKVLANPNNDAKSKKLDEIKEKIIDFDKTQLEVSNKAMEKLRETFSEISSILSKIVSDAQIESFMPFGSFLNQSLRRYKLEIDVLAIYDYGNSVFPSQKLHKEILEKIKELFIEAAISLELDEKYNILMNESRGFHFLNISLADDFHSHDSFSMIKIIPFNKYTGKFNMMLKIQRDMMRSSKRESLSDLQRKELKILTRYLRYIKDHKWPDLKGEIVDLLIYNITSKFSEIDIIRNIKRFFEFIALGGLSCNKNNVWFWHQFPEAYFDYMQADLSKSLKEKMEKDAKEIVDKGFDIIIKLEFE